MVSWQAVSQKKNAQAKAESQINSANFLVLELQRPIEGLPLLTDWLRTAGDIWFNGYEGWRSPIEARVVSPEVLGKSMEPGVLLPVKGFGRASMIFFGVVFTYVTFPEMEGEFLEDFQRHGFLQKCCRCQLCRL